MATVTRYVNTASTAGGDGTTNNTTGATRAYATLNEWESNEQTDLVTDGDVHVVHCEGSAADTTTVNITGWTTGASNDITVQVDAGATRHQGLYSTSYYRLETSTAFEDCITTDENYVSFIGLQINNQDTNNRDGISFSGTGKCVLAYCIVKGDDVDGRYGFELSGAADYDVYNNILHNLVTFGIYITAGGTVNVYNNTVFMDAGSANIYVHGVTTLNLKNNLCNEGATGPTIEYDLGGNTTTNTATNLSEDTSSPDDALDSLTVTFENEGTDFHLASGDTSAKDAGTDLSGDAALSFNDDIDGDTRSGSWDVGADEFVAAGGTILPQMMHHHSGVAA